MWSIVIFIYFVLTNLISSLPVTTNNEFYYNRHITSLKSLDYNNNLDDFNVSSISRDSASSDMCLSQSINIDKPINETNIQQRVSTTTATIDMSQFMSSWQQQVVINNDDHSLSLNMIEITFTIPYSISNESILNKTVFITDVIYNQLLASLTDICINASSFSINYSTIQPLPHNICLYLLLNLTSSMILREIMFCRTIEDSNNYTTSSNDSETTSDTVGPSGIFILSQCVIIVIMMFIIYGVQTARQKSLGNRISQRLIRSRPYMIVFGDKAVVRTGSNPSINPATTLQAGLNRIAFKRHLSLLPDQKPTPIEEQVLAANDLTSTINARRASRRYSDRGLIDIKEFTRKMSIVNENSTDTELQPM